jgi:hypothetical protein
MKERFALLNAELVSGTDVGDGEELIRLINENVRPPEPVTSQDILIRSMYIVSDEVNSYGGRFPVDEHDRLAGLLVDSPVLVGHRKDGLPIGRTFHACTVERNGRPWVRSYFYWLKSAEGAETLRDNIDKGVYKECSIGFTYLLPECSVCGDDIRRCRHNLFQSYGTAENESRCHFNYRKIERVLETSLVFRGATPGTAMSKDLTMTAELDKPHQLPSGDLPIIESLDQLADGVSYLVVPHYEGKLLTITGDGNEVRMADGQGDTLKVPEVEQVLAVTPSQFAVTGRLVGYRGKERRSKAELDRYLVTGAGPISRIVLFLYPDGSEMSTGIIDSGGSIRTFHHGIMTKEDITGHAQEFATKHGVEIWERSRDGSLSGGVRYIPARVDNSRRDGFELCIEQGTGARILRIESAQGTASFHVSGFPTTRLNSGARFIADKVSGLPAGKYKPMVRGEILAITESGGYRLKPSYGPGELRLQPIRLNCLDRFLLYYERRR